MANRGAQPGNQNASKAPKVTDALRMALAQNDWQKLREGCQKVAEAFAMGEQWAAQMVFDRLDGKPKQTMEVNQTVTHVHAETGDELARKLSGRTSKPLGNTLN